MKTNRSLPVLVFVVIAGLGAVLGFSLHAAGQQFLAFIVFGSALVVAAVISSAIRVTDQWSKAVVLRLGKFRALQGPGLFFIIPLIDTIRYWIDTRVLTSSFKAEKRTRKTLFPWTWMPYSFGRLPIRKKQPLPFADYQSAISWASQTALRDVIDKTMLSDMLAGVQTGNQAWNAQAWNDDPLCENTARHKDRTIREVRRTNDVWRLRLVCGSADFGTLSG